MTPTSHSQHEPNTNGTLIKILVLALLLLAVLAGALWFQQSWGPQQGTNRHPCDLQQGPCKIELTQGTLQLDAGPLPLRSLSPIKLQLQLEGSEARQIKANLQGSDMYMGVNSFEFQPGDTTGQWLGQTELAVCTTGQMRWQLILDLITDSGTEQHLFEFEAR